MKEAGTFDCVVDMICYHPPEAESDLRAFQGRVGQLIFCSTVDVYTKPALVYPVREDPERKPNPAFEYAYHKALCEQIFERARDQRISPTVFASMGMNVWLLMAKISLGRHSAC